MGKHINHFLKHLKTFVHLISVYHNVIIIYVLELLVEINLCLFETVYDISSEFVISYSLCIDKNFNQPMCLSLEFTLEIILHSQRLVLSVLINRTIMTTSSCSNFSYLS